MNYPEGTDSNPTAHHPIIEKWISLGVTQKKDPNGGLDKDNIERVDNRGLAMILPYFSASVTVDQRIESVNACHQLVCELNRQGKRLPVEATNPYVTMSLFHPEDPNVVAFERSGFSVDAHPGFGWFYPQGETPQLRTMVTRPITPNQ